MATLVALGAVALGYLGALALGVGLLALTVALLWIVFSMFTTVSILAVFFAVGTMVMGRAVTSGFSQEFKDKVLGFNAHVLVMKWGYGLTEYKQVIREVRGIPNVTGAAPFTISDMLVAKEREPITPFVDRIRELGPIRPLAPAAPVSNDVWEPA